MTPSELLGSFASLTELVSGIETGREEAAAQLYRICQDGFTPYLRRRMKRDEAEHVADVLHGAYAITLEFIQAGKMREPECLLGVVARVVHGQWCRHVQSVRKQRSHLASLQQSGVPGVLGDDTEWQPGGPGWDATWLNSIASDDPDPEEAYSWTEQRRILRQALNEMPRRHAEILQRSYLLEQSELQVRFAMGLSGNQFRVEKSRALDELSVIGKKLAGLPRQKRVVLICHSERPDPSCQRCRARLRRRQAKKETKNLAA